MVSAGHEFDRIFNTHMATDNSPKFAGVPLRSQHGQDEVKPSKERDTMDEAMTLHVDPLIFDGLKKRCLEIGDCRGWGNRNAWVVAPISEVISAPSTQIDRCRFDGRPSSHEEAQEIGCRSTRWAVVAQ
jgi:hypothetical protein